LRIKGAFFPKMTRHICAKFLFQGLGENNCSLQSALENIAPGPLNLAMYYTKMTRVRKVTLFECKVLTF